MGEIYKYKDLVDAYADAAPVGEGVEGGAMGSGGQQTNTTGTGGGGK